MSITATAAANAYAATAKAAVPATSTAPTNASSKTTGFGELVKEAMEQVNTMGQVADQNALAQAAGKADMIDVVTAVTETELAVQTLVSVRDRVISAYQEVMRMPI